MKTLSVLLAVFLLLTALSCGKAPARQKKSSEKKKISSLKKESNNTAKEKPAEEKILDAEEFRKAFSTPKYRNKRTSEAKPLEPLPYTIDGLEKSAFDNAEFKDQKALKHSSAGKLRKKHLYSWLPLWHYTGSGGVSLPDAAISSDLSLLAILETVPRGTVDKGTMIILINTYNWTVLRIHYFKDHLFTRVLFVPEQDNLIVWEETQHNKKHRKIHSIDIESGSLISSSRDISDALSGIALDPYGKQLFLKTSNGKKSIYVFSTLDLEEKPAKRKCNQEAANIAVSNNRLVLAGKEKIITYKLSFNQKMAEVENKFGFIPENIIFAGGTDKLAFSEYMKSVFVLIGSQTKELSKTAGHVIFYRKDIDILAFEEYRRRQIVFVKMSDFAQISTLIPERIKPKTKAGALFLSYLPHIEKYIVLDTKGNLCLYHQPGKKWRKKIIFSAKK